MDKRICVVGCDLGPGPMAYLREQFPEFEFLSYPRNAKVPDEVLARAEVLMNYGDKSQIAPAKNVRYIHTISAGIDGYIDEVDRCHGSALPVTNGAGVYSDAVGEHVIALLLAGGFTDVMAKVYAYYGQAALKNQYLVYTFLTALLLCTALIFAKRQRLGKWEVLFGILIGVPNYISSRFLLLSLDSVPAVVAYPTYSVGAIVLISLAGFAVFHERFTRRRLAALGVILISLVLLNL